MQKWIWWVDYVLWPQVGRNLSKWGPLRIAWLFNMCDSGLRHYRRVLECQCLIDGWQNVSLSSAVAHLFHFQFYCPWEALDTKTQLTHMHTTHADTNTHTLIFSACCFSWRLWKTIKKHQRKKLSMFPDPANVRKAESMCVCVCVSLWISISKSMSVHTYTCAHVPLSHLRTQEYRPASCSSAGRNQMASSSLLMRTPSKEMGSSKSPCPNPELRYHIRLSPMLCAWV